MFFFRRFGRLAWNWAGTNPLKAAELAVALTFLAATLLTTKRLDRRALRRIVRVFL